MEKPISISNLAQFTKAMDGYNYNNQIVALSISPFSHGHVRNLSKSTPTTTFNMITFMIILSGEIEMSINYISYKFKKNNWVEIAPNNTVGASSMSNDFYAQIIMVSESFIVDTILDKKPIPISHFVDIRETPSILLTDSDMTAMKYSMDRIFYYIRKEGHNYKQDLLHNTFYNFILESSNIFTNIDKNRTNQQVLSRKQNLLHQFMYLVGKHSKEQHSPAFYSDKLCISTQYLSIILKEITGKTASFWISKAIITDAKTLLRTPGNTIQQVTDILHFSDQSSFGKFFKKYTGISPKKYREDYSSPR